MSIGRPNQFTIISPAEYEANQAKIEQGKQYLASLEEMNKAGMSRYDDLEAKKRELQKKVEEGLQAQRLMEQLETLQAGSSVPLLENGSGHDFTVSSARIEEVHPNDLASTGLPQNGRPIPSTDSNSQQRLPSSLGSRQPAPPQYNMSNSIHQAQHITSTSSGRQSTLQAPSSLVAPISSQSVTSYPSSISNTKSGMPTAQGGMPTAQGGMPAVQGGMPAAQREMSAVQGGMPAVQGGMPTAQGGMPAAQGGMPAARGGMLPAPRGIPVKQGNFQQIPSQPSASSSSMRPPPPMSSQTPVFHSRQGVQQMRSYQNIATGSTSVQQPPSSSIQRTKAKSGYWPPVTNTQITNQTHGSYYRQSETSTANNTTQSHYSRPKTPSLPPATSSQRSSSTSSNRNQNDFETQQIPYLEIPDNEVHALKQRATVWLRQAPLNALHELHPKITIHKDSEAIGWVYVPSGTGLYWRFRDIDKFFGRQFSMFKPPKGQVPQTQKQPISTDTSNGRTIKIPSAVQTPPNGTPVSNGKDPKVKVPGPSSSKTPTVTIPSGLISPVRSLSQVDKKHLSKHIMFALGKRPRDESSSSTAEGENPAKRHAVDATIAKRSEVSTSSQSAPAQSSPPTNTTQPSGSSTIPSISESVHPVSKMSSFPTELTFNKSNNEDTHLTSNSSLPDITTATLESSSKNLNSISSRTSNGVEENRPAASTVAEPSSTPVISMPPNASSLIPPNMPVAPSSENVTQLQSTYQTIAIPQEYPIASTSKVAASAIDSHNYPPNQIILSPSRNSSIVNQESSFDVGTISPKYKEPLFLPSVSPEPSRRYRFGPEGKASAREVEAPGGAGKRRVYVLVPPPPDYLVRHRQRVAIQRNGRGGGSGEESGEIVTSGPGRVRTRLGTKGKPASSVSTPVEDFFFESQHDSPVDELEQEALRLVYSRLEEIPCRWDGCEVVMNCVDSLILHLNEHRPAPSPNNQYFTCRWTQCGRRCNYNEDHLEKHASLPLRCAYVECTESFRSGSRLSKHFQAKHRNDTLKPAAQICKPPLETPPDVPRVVPAYLFVTDTVGPAAISSARHQQICPVVVRNIVNSDQEKPTRQRTRKTARSSNRHALLAAGASSDYEFMTTRTTRYSSYLSQAVDIALEDLDSATISEMVDEGLMLWKAEGGTDDEDDGDAKKSQPNGSSVPIASGVKGATQPGLDTTAAPPTLDHSHQEHSSDEDATVEGMLTEVPTKTEVTV